MGLSDKQIEQDITWWYRTKKATTVGPISMQKIIELYAERKIDGTTYVFSEHPDRSENWIQLMKIPEISRILGESANTPQSNTGPGLGAPASKPDMLRAHTFVARQRG